MPRRRTTVTLVDGRLVDDRKPQVSVFDNALLYAEGLFETCLGIDSRVVFVREHLERLWRGARVTGFGIPACRERIATWLHRACRLHPDRITQIRLTVTAGESARWTGVPGKPRILISAAPYTMRQEPYRLWVSDLRVDQHSIFRRIKTVSYGIHAAALKQAHRHGCEDALLLNERGHIAEATSANIFWIRRGRLYTPPLDAGCLDGITRRKILVLARRMGLPVVEKTGPLDHLAAADEVFISSSLKLAAPVGSIRDGRHRHRFPVGPVTLELAHRFFRLTGLPDELRPF